MSETLLPENRVGDWRDYAACKDEDPELHFPVNEKRQGGWHGMQVAEATQVCNGCEVRETCLEYALETDQQFGVWGALNSDERRALKRKMSRTGRVALQ